MELTQRFTNEGICGDKSPTRIHPDNVKSWVTCTLPTGHEGWHHSNSDGSDWLHGTPRPEESR